MDLIDEAPECDNPRNELDPDEESFVEEIQEGSDSYSKKENDINVSSDLV